MTDKKNNAVPYGNAPSKTAFWRRLYIVTTMLNLPKSANHLLGYCAELAEFDRPELNITIDYLAACADLSARSTQRGMHALHRAGIIVPRESRGFYEIGQHPKGGAHKAVCYDIIGLKIGWDLSGIDGDLLWAMTANLMKKLNKDDYDEFIKPMRFMKVHKEPGVNCYIIELQCKSPKLALRFNQGRLAIKTRKYASLAAGEVVKVCAVPRPMPVDKSPKPVDNSVDKSVDNLGISEKK